MLNYVECLLYTNCIVCLRFFINMIVYRELKSLESDLGIPLKTLFAVSNSVSHHYRRVKLEKRSGGYRILSVPDEILKKIQSKIYEVILARCEVSQYASAYHFGASVQRNAAPHVGKRTMLKLDIKHFFDSILYSAVKDKCFPAERFSEPVRILLTMLCYHGDALPQGAPTSPIISNIIMKDFDEAVGSFCRERGISYTRYSDDLTFSGDFDADVVKSFVKNELFARGFTLNSSKTRLIGRNARQTVTGIVVNDKLSSPRAYRRELRKELHYISAHGLDEHLCRSTTTEEKTKYLNKLLGRINFVLSTDHNNKEFQEYKSKIISIKKGLTQ